MFHFSICYHVSVLYNSLSFWFILGLHTSFWVTALYTFLRIFPFHSSWCTFLLSNMLKSPLHKLNTYFILFQHYAQYVISVMGKLCAPVRDEKIRELTQTQGVVPMFRGIMEVSHMLKKLVKPILVSKMMEQLMYVLISSATLHSSRLMSHHYYCCLYWNKLSCFS